MCLLGRAKHPHVQVAGSLIIVTIVSKRGTGIGIGQHRTPSFLPALSAASSARRVQGVGSRVIAHFCATDRQSRGPGACRRRRRRTRWRSGMHSAFAPTSTSQSARLVSGSGRGRPQRPRPSLPQSIPLHLRAHRSWWMDQRLPWRRLVLLLVTESLSLSTEPQTSSSAGPIAAVHS